MTTIAASADAISSRFMSSALRGIRLTGRSGRNRSTCAKVKSIHPNPAGARIPRKAFETLYREHVQAVYRFAMSVAGRKETAEDLTSEAFLALFRHFDSIDDSRLPAWLITVV